MKAFLRWLRLHDACKEGIALVRDHPTPEAWWAASERGDHMLWLAARARTRRQDVVLAACACARLALQYVPEGEERPRIAIETAERWARGEDGVTLADVRAAADAAAAYADYADYAAYAAYAAADAATYAAYAADAAAYAADADAAAYAAAAAAAAAAYADADDARGRVLRECATLVRERIPWSAVAAAIASPSPATPGDADHNAAKEE